LSLNHGGTQPYPSNIRGAGFYADCYLQPADVSFKGISIGEEGVGGKLNMTVKATREGSLKNLTPELHSAWYWPAQSGNVNTECHVGQGRYS
jgi:hypothetical protein